MALVQPDPWQRQFVKPVAKKKTAAPMPPPWHGATGYTPPPPRGPAAPDVPGGILNGILPGLGYTPTQPSPNPFNYNTDPGYQAALAAEQTGSASADAMLKQRVADIMVAFGDPTWAANAGFGLDPQAAAAAQANYKSGNSALSRLEHSRDLQKMQIINSLASHGLVFSGALGFQEGENERSFGNARYDAQQQALGAVRGYQDQSLQQKQALRQAVIDSMQNAYRNYLDNPWAYAGAG